MKYIVTLLFLFITTYSISAQDINYDAIKTEFKVDTAKIEQQTRNMLNKDYSTIGMIEATNFSEQEYDTLLNKYYKILYNSLNSNGQKALKESQRNWIKLRDSDNYLIREMIGQIYDEMGGGTIWGIIGANARADVTRRRVIDIYNYLMLSDIGGK